MTCPHIQHWLACIWVAVCGLTALKRLGSCAKKAHRGTPPDGVLFAPAEAARRCFFCAYVCEHHVTSRFKAAAVASVSSRTR